MTYASLPTTGQTLGNTRDQIRTNFDIIKSVQTVNHIAFDLADEGKHKFLQMPEQVAAPVTAANEGGFYTKDLLGTNLVYRSESNGNEYQITAVNDANFTKFATNTLYDATPQNQNGGWTFLPGGLLLQYGIATSINSGDGVIRYPRSFSLAPYSIQLTMQTSVTSTTPTFYIRNIVQAPNEMYVHNSSSQARTCNWIAIGPA